MIRHRRLEALFLAALLGVLTAITLVVAALGPLAVALYLVVVGGGFGLLLRPAVRARRREHGRTCDCCTSTVFDPVEVR